MHKTAIDRTVMIRPYDLYVCKSRGEFEELKQEYKFQWDWNEECDGQYVETLSYKTDTMMHIIYFTNMFDESVIAHEAVHAAEGFFRKIGEEFPSEEFRCYVIQNLFRQIQEKLLS